mmetsp:Transcript_109178/g.307876  ORF Transcript_109178/g.307876 Transcript_109178/m.307876 type:complete len:220 (+) Transcript_109178:121-780(+)
MPILFSSKSSSKEDSLACNRSKRRATACASATQPTSVILFRRSRNFRRALFLSRAETMAFAVVSVRPGNWRRRLITRSTPFVSSASASRTAPASAIRLALRFNVSMVGCGAASTSAKVHAPRSVSWLKRKFSVSNRPLARERLRARAKTTSSFMKFFSKLARDSLALCANNGASTAASAPKTLQPLKETRSKAANAAGPSSPRMRFTSSKASRDQTFST